MSSTVCRLMLVASICVSCSDDAIPLCTDADWYPVAPYLTAPPEFSSDQLTSGDPLSLTFRVSPGTSRIDARIRAVDDPSSNSPGILIRESTEGESSVRLPVETESLGMGEYLLSGVTLHKEPPAVGLTFPRGRFAVPMSSAPTASDVGAPYEAEYYFGADGFLRRCETDLPAAAFEIVGTAE